MIIPSTKGYYLEEEEDKAAAHKYKHLVIIMIFLGPQRPFFP